VKILLVKTSSMGDVVHTLHALNDVRHMRPDTQIDWLLEEAFSDIADIARQNDHIKTIIPIAFRRWRKRKPFGLCAHPAIKALRKRLKSEHYDLIIDAQGLVKSAYLARLAKVPIAGYDKRSIREPLASLFYRHVYRISKQQHAIFRLRQLFAKALDYSLSDIPVNNHTSTIDKSNNHILLFHGTSWNNKHYPLWHWQQVAAALNDLGYQVDIPYNSPAEQKIAENIACGKPDIYILDKQPLSQLIEHIKNCRAVISLDTGLAHLATYLNKPVVFLFGPTNPRLTGGIASNTFNLSGLATDHCSMQRLHYRYEHEYADSMAAIEPHQVIKALKHVLSDGS